MTDKQRDKVWELVDRISDIAIDIDIFANDITNHPVNGQHLAMCRRVAGGLMAIAAELESVAYDEPESK